eukprot:7391877-Prymnesium_polylepis.4
MLISHSSFHLRYWERSSTVSRYWARHGWDSHGLVCHRAPPGLTRPHKEKQPQIRPCDPSESYFYYGGLTRGRHAGRVAARRPLVGGSRRCDA